MLCLGHFESRRRDEVQSICGRLFDVVQLFTQNFANFESCVFKNDDRIDGQLKQKTISNLVVRRSQSEEVFFVFLKSSHHVEGNIVDRRETESGSFWTMDFFYVQSSCQKLYNSAMQSFSRIGNQGIFV